MSLHEITFTNQKAREDARFILRGCSIEQASVTCTHCRQYSHSWFIQIDGVDQFAISEIERKSKSLRYLEDTPFNTSFSAHSPTVSHVMSRSQSTRSISARLPIPKDLHVGAVIGQGGSNVKKLRSQTGAFCNIDSKRHEAIVSGSREGVDRAIDKLQDLFHRLQLERLQRLEKLRQQRWQQQEIPPGQHRIYRVAVTTDSNSDSWLFQRRLDNDDDSNSHENRLVRLETFDAEDDNSEVGDDCRDSWISKFTPAFLQQINEDLSGFSTRSDIKIKATLGMTCYGFPNPQAASRLYTWGQLQGLRVHEDIRRRWENYANMRSASVSSFMHMLELLIQPNTSYETLLTVYIGQGLVGNDLSFKFQLVDGVWNWVPDRPPIRKALALYNIGLDDDTAFRIRVYSRASMGSIEALTEVWSYIDVIEHPSGDPFRTEVKLTNDAPSSMFIRSLALRQKTSVDLQGLRVSISYCDYEHKQATVQCQALNDGSISSVSERVQNLIDKMLEAFQVPA